MISRADAAAIVPGTRERWLSKTVCTLARAFDIKVRWVESGHAPSWWDAAARTVVLNAADPEARDPRDVHAYAKGKLFHELAHVLFSVSRTIPEILSAVGAPTSRVACCLWNVLEDGRIERKLARTLPGCGRYIRNVLRAFGAPTDEFGDLVQRVRRDGPWSYRKGSRYARVDSEIRRALIAPDSYEVARIVAGIIAKVHPPEPPQDAQQCYRPGGTPDPKAVPDKADKGKDASEDPAEDSETGPIDTEDPGDTGADDGAPGEDSDSEDGASDADPDDDDSASGDPADGAGHGKRDDDPDEDPDDAPSSARDDEQQAREDSARVRADAESELETMASEPIDPEAQEFVDDTERTHAESIAHYIDALRFDATRDHWTPTTTGGRIDPSRIVGALTGDAYRVDMEPAAGFEFACAVLVDRSGSMDMSVFADGTYVSRMKLALASARILHGALKLAGIESRTFLFDDAIREVAQVPQSFRTGGGTEGEYALRHAAGVLEESTAYRRLILMVTDGGFSSSAGMLSDLETKGVYVARIQIGDPTGYNQPETPEYAQAHEIHDISAAPETLPQVIESIIMQFAQAGHRD